MNGLEIINALSKTSVFNNDEVDKLLSCLHREIDFDTHCSSLDLRAKISEKEQFCDVTSDHKYIIWNEN